MGNKPGFDLGRGAIRRFTASGAPDGSYIPENSLPPAKGHPDARMGLTDGAVASSKDRFGWYLNHDNVYFEISTAGTVTQYPGVQFPGTDDRVTKLAILDNGTVILSSYEFEDKTNAERLYALDRPSKTWKNLPVPGGAAGVLYGGYGNTIALNGRDWSTIAFFEVK